MDCRKTMNVLCAASTSEDLHGSLMGKFGEKSWPDIMGNSTGSERTRREIRWILPDIKDFNQPSTSNLKNEESIGLTIDERRDSLIDCSSPSAASSAMCSDYAESSLCPWSPPTNYPAPGFSQSKDRKKKVSMLAMTDIEFAWFERAHMESHLLEIYSEPSLRFYTTPPTPYFTLVHIPLQDEGSNSGYRSSEGQMMRSFDHTVPPPAPPTSLFDEKGNFKISRMDVLSEEIWAFHNQTTQTDTILNRKLYLRDLLYYVICPIFPMCGLYVVGSSLNGFGNNNSDMDLCLMITNQELDQRNDAIVVLNLVFSELEKIEWISKQHLIFAKVPILRIEFESPYSDIIVDLNVNNSVAIKNTHLLCYYSSFDWRVRPLVTIVKEWAKKKGINDANQSSFTSYSLVLMVIHYLQCGVEPRLLPSLQKIFAKRFQRNADIRTLNATQPLPTIEGWVYNEKMTLGELLIGFLDYYANRFDYDRDAISIYEGERIDRAAVAKVPRNGVGAGRFGSHWRSQWRCICIEEPFTHLNTAHSIYDEMVFEEIKNAFRESHDELNSTRDLRKWLTNCKAITACPPKVGQFSH